jgi:hypothetical protein
MSAAAAWMRRLRDRPIAEHERHTAISVVVVVLTASAVALALTGHASHASDTQHPVLRTTSGAEARSIRHEQADRDFEERRVATRFLGGYLNFIYGHGETWQIADATGSLIASLRAQPRRVPPGMRNSHPRVISAQPAQKGETRVIAVINDGGPVDYPIGLRFALDRGRMLVSEVGGA